jgi:hypothetical protein
VEDASRDVPWGAPARPYWPLSDELLVFATVGLDAILRLLGQGGESDHVTMNAEAGELPKYRPYPVGPAP